MRRVDIRRSMVTLLAKPTSASLLLCILLLGLVSLISGCGQTNIHSEIWYIHRYQALSPDGTRYPQDEIDAVDAVSRQVRHVIRAIPEDFITGAGLAPDGKRIAYSVTAPGFGQSVWLATVEAPRPIQISPDYQEDIEFVWLDSARLVVMGTNEPWAVAEDGDWLLYHVDTGQEETLQVGDPIHIPWRLSRSGARPDRVPLSGIALGHLQMGGRSIRVVTEVPLDEASSQEALSCRSSTPNGERIACTGESDASDVDNASGVEDVFLIEAKEHSSKRLTDFRKKYAQASVDGLALSPDGKWIIFDGSFREPGLPAESTLLVIGLVDTAGGTPQFLGWLDTASKKPEFVGDWFNFGDFVWSPDSKYVGTSLRTPGDADLGQEVYRIDVATRKVSALTSDGDAKRVFDWR